ncbi:hypothetical protein ATJ97_1277 [Georgenia soli]|uniref:Uncharacterized protein n=1 Tax=Georgenia soli TaxID=638953 RepID=A0A2A9EKM6_9MICO|nr:hypothetical protein [Georgenia soli]PFG38790.1 hypothetical protein ATJ97_1277 [Georgenia soli]
MTFLLLAASPTPAPAPSEMEPWEVSPGLIGFLLGFFVLAIAVVPLFRSMAKHMRRVDHNERLRQAAEEGAAARAGADPGHGYPVEGAATRGAVPERRVVEGGPTSAGGTGTGGGAGRAVGPDRPSGEGSLPDDAGPA